MASARKRIFFRTSPKSSKSSRPTSQNSGRLFTFKTTQFSFALRFCFVTRLFDYGFSHLLHSSFDLLSEVAGSFAGLFALAGANLNASLIDPCLDLYGREHSSAVRAAGASCIAGAGPRIRGPREVTSSRDGPRTPHCTGRHFPRRARDRACIPQAVYF